MRIVAAVGPNNRLLIRNNTSSYTMGGVFDSDGEEVGENLLDFSDEENSMYITLLEDI